LILNPRLNIQNPKSLVLTSKLTLQTKPPKRKGRSRTSNCAERPTVRANSFTSSAPTLSTTWVRWPSSSATHSGLRTCPTQTRHPSPPPPRY